MEPGERSRGGAGRDRLTCFRHSLTLPHEQLTDFPCLSARLCGLGLNLFPPNTPGLTVGRLQDDSLTVGPDARGVESLDPGIVGAVEVKAVDGAQGLLADVHLLEETQTARQAPPLCGKFLLAAR